MDFNKILTNKKITAALDSNHWALFFTEVNYTELSMNDFHKLIKLLLSEASDEIVTWINKLKPKRLTKQSIIINSNSTYSHWSDGIKIVNKSFCYNFKWLTFLYWSMFPELSFYEQEQDDYITNGKTSDVLGFFAGEDAADGYLGRFNRLKLYVGIPLNDWDHQIVYNTILSDTYKYYVNSRALLYGMQSLLDDVANSINDIVDELIDKLIKRINKIRNENN